jgi:hypothetical protein
MSAEDNLLQAKTEFGFFLSLSFFNHSRNDLNHAIEKARRDLRRKHLKLDFNMGYT